MGSLNPNNPPWARPPFNQDSWFQSLQTPATNHANEANFPPTTELANNELSNVAPPSELAIPIDSLSDLYTLDDLDSIDSELWRDFLEPELSDLLFTPPSSPENILNEPYPQNERSNGVPSSGLHPTSSSADHDEILIGLDRRIGEPASRESEIIPPPAYISNKHAYQTTTVSGGTSHPDEILVGVNISTRSEESAYHHGLQLHPALANISNEHAHLTRPSSGGISNIRTPPTFSHRPDEILAGIEAKDKQKMSYNKFAELLESPTTPLDKYALEPWMNGNRNMLKEEGPSTSQYLGIPSEHCEGPIQERIISVKEEQKTPPVYSNKTCNCKKSHCVQQYCGCFTSQLYCFPCCCCEDCMNRREYDDKLEQARELAESRKEKEAPVKGCACKMSRCAMKYCECFKTENGCSPECQCKECENTYGYKNSADTAAASAAPEIGDPHQEILTANNNGHHSDENASDVEPPSDYRVAAPPTRPEDDEHSPSSDLIHEADNSPEFHIAEGPQFLMNGSDLEGNNNGKRV